MSNAEKYMILLLYANKNGTKGRLWLHAEMNELLTALKLKKKKPGPRGARQENPDWKISRVGTPRQE